jgi:hypothetical protein
MKAIIISKPKSGTFLLSNLIDLMGMDFKGIFIHDNSRHQYDIADKTNRVALEKVPHPLEKSIEKVEDNEVIVSHLLPTPEARRLLKEFKKIIITRNHDEIKVSYNNWSKALSNRPAKYDVNKYLPIPDWLEEPNSFGLKFNDLIYKNEKVINDLQLFLLGEIKYDSRVVCQTALNMDSVTKMR